MKPQLKDRVFAPLKDGVRHFVRTAVSSGVFICNFLFLMPSSIGERDWNACVEKQDSKWGSDCSNSPIDKDTYLVSLKNICSEKIDVIVCVQEIYNNLRCYTQYELPPQDTVFGYACKGTGKYLYWVREAGDKQTTFPTIEEVNSTN